MEVSRARRSLAGALGGLKMMRQAGCAVAPALWVMVIGVVLADSPRYPNELPAYEFHAQAEWGALQPLITTQAEADVLLRDSKPGFFKNGHHWIYTVHYWGAGGSCAGRPYPASLIGTVAYIEVEPKGRVSFSNVCFPPQFRKHELMGAHDRVGSWLVYEDELGLAYHVYDKSSDDGTVQPGDLKAIVYGPSRQVYQDLTHCVVADG